jgi:hypothetical protein
MEIGTGANRDGAGARTARTAMSAACAETDSRAMDEIAAKAMQSFMTIPGFCHWLCPKPYLNASECLFFVVALAQQSKSIFLRLAPDDPNRRERLSPRVQRGQY